ncbi:hypothetical protein T06_16459, partial [Trichinella sp. T6]
LHIPSSYAQGILLHNICPQGSFMQIFNRLGPQALPSGYAPGQIKICIFPQAMPKAFYCTIFALRGYARGYASGKISKISNFIKYSPRLCPRANKNLHIPSRYAQEETLGYSLLLGDLSFYTYLFSPP